MLKRVERSPEEFAVELTERKRQILKIVVEGYIRTAEPVEFPAGKFLQLVIPMRTSNAAPDYSLGMVRLLKNLKKLVKK